MIESMRKHTFVIYYPDYPDFLVRLQDLGMVHISRSSEAKTEALLKTRDLIERMNAAAKYVGKYINDESDILHTTYHMMKILKQVENAQSEKEKLQRHADGLRKGIGELKPWGHFDRNLVQMLKAQGIAVDFYTCPKNHFREEWKSNHTLHELSLTAGHVYFVVIHQDDQPIDLDADTFRFPEMSLVELEKKLKETQEKQQEIETFFLTYAKSYFHLFQDEIIKLTAEYDYEDAVQQGIPEADEHILILTGWIPKRLEAHLVQFIQQQNIIHYATDPQPHDNVPISLRNGKFAKLFEPIARMFMLPHYNDLDLTPFFAPFFMLFFGFCNADIMYGISLIILAVALKKKIKNPAVNSYLTLIMLFGISAILMGWLTGTILGFDLKLTPLSGAILITETDQIFNLALTLGALQILFGVMIRVHKGVRQRGIMGGIAPLGVFVFLFSLTLMGAEMLKANIGVLSHYTKWLMYAGLGMVMLFNSPGKNIFVNLGSGLWEMYNVVTGFLGDILSYIRLFALGVSSTILGLVVNSIAQNLLSIPIAGYLAYPVFMLFGHALNLALGALGGFIHPLRLTFVEFYKNAGFEGPGLEYRPFTKNRTVK